MKSGRFVRCSVAVALLFAMLLTLAAARPAAAATIVVDGVTCTLADAITAANTDAATGGCPAGSGADTLDLVADITLTSRLPAIVSEVTLQGNGHTIQRSPAAPAFRILEIDWYGNATIDGVTITGGDDDDGGGILNKAQLTITNSTIEGNAASSGGGVYCLHCQLFMSRSIVRNNSATYSGGGIRFYFYKPTGETKAVGHEQTPENSYCGLGYYTGITESSITGNSAQIGGGLSYHGSSFFVEGSTISDNTAVTGGGLSNYRGSGCIDSTTFSGNTASEKGGALYNESFALKNEAVGPNPLAIPAAEHDMVHHESFEIPDYGGFLDLSNSTIVDNSGPLGAGLYTLHVGPPYPAFVGRVEPLNTIMAAQTSGVDCVSENGARIISQGYNIESTASCGFTAGGDQQNVSAAQLNLAPLADNGGPTWTHALTPNSPAIDQGNCPIATADQRGYPRPVNQISVPNAADGCDVGAFELQIPTAVTLTQLDAVNRNADARLVLAALLVPLLLIVGLAHRK